MNFTHLSKDDSYLAPSLLAADFSRLNDELSFIRSQNCRVLHLDVMDGHFVPNLSFGVPVIKAIRGRTDLLFDTHLMISNPLDYIDAFAAAGSDHITFHYEAKSPIEETIKAIRKRGLSVGLSLKLSTDPSELLPYLSEIDLLLVMSVDPGFGGQSFDRKSLESLRFFKKFLSENNRALHLSIDGGVGLDNKEDLLEAGANIFVAGTSFFNKSFLSL